MSSTNVKSVIDKNGILVRFSVAKIKNGILWTSKKINRGFSCPFAFSNAKYTKQTKNSSKTTNIRFYRAIFFPPQQTKRKKIMYDSLS